MENYNWNKNIIARILKNESYKGSEKYPQVISEELFNKVQDAMKPYTKRQDNEIKKMRQTFVCDYCGNKVKRRTKIDGVERWYCEQDTTHVSSKVKDEILLESFTKLLDQSLKDDILYGEVLIECSKPVRKKQSEFSSKVNVENFFNKYFDIITKHVDITGGVGTLERGVSISFSSQIYENLIENIHAEMQKDATKQQVVCILHKETAYDYA